MAARQDAPAKVHIELYEPPFSGLRFFPDFLVIYGLRGKTLITEGSERYTLEKGGLLTINQFRKHEIRCEYGAGVSVLHIPQEVLYLIDENELLLRVHCYVRSSEPGSRQEYDHLRTNYAHVFQNYFQTAPHSDILVLSYTSSLLGLLTKHFCSAGKTSPAGNNTDVLERCSRIIQYIHGHWQEEISIESIADACGSAGRFPSVHSIRKPSGHDRCLEKGPPPPSYMATGPEFRLRERGPACGSADTDPEGTERDRI